MTVRGFDSFEEMQAALSKDIAAAKRKIKPFQRELLDGKEHHFMRLVSYPGEMILIVGKTIDLDVYLDTQLLKATSKIDALEWRAAMAGHWKGMRNGFVLSYCYPEGEMGDTHVATVLPISPEDYLAFEEMKWSLEEAVNNPHTAALIARWVKDVHYQ